MERLKSPQAMRRRLQAAREGGASVGFVPTMGDLHAGHMALVAAARARHDHVVVSVFVNPLQFGPAEDYGSYPRRLEADAQTLEAAGVATLFAPAPEDIYPRGLAATTRVEVPGLTSILCGASRPGHFTGVATVVAILLNIVRPDAAYFGEKDYQQLRVIRRMVEDLQLAVEVAGVPTQRAPDGLALSSRNRYLGPAERAVAPTLHQALAEAARRLRAGGRDFPALEEQAAARLRAAGFRVDYVRILEAETLERPRPEGHAFVVLGAAWLGEARLIDNVTINDTAEG